MLKPRGSCSLENEQSWSINLNVAINLKSYSHNQSINKHSTEDWTAAVHFACGHLTGSSGSVGLNAGWPGLLAWSGGMTHAVGLAEVAPRVQLAWSLACRQSSL